MKSYANECPGCLNWHTLNHANIHWVYYCHKCKWGFGLKRDIENEFPPLNYERDEDNPIDYQVVLDDMYAYYYIENVEKDTGHTYDKCVKELIRRHNGD